MHITGMIDNNHTREVIESVKYFLGTENKRVSITEYENRFRTRETWHDYWSALMRAETEILIVRIKEEDLYDAMDILPLDTIIVNDYPQWQMVLKRIRPDDKKSFKDLMVIFNSDVIKPSNFSDEMKCRSLSYGFNSGSKITTSSTGEPFISGQFLCCIKEKLVSVNGRTIEPQEFVMNLHNMNDDPYDVLAAASIAVLYDVDLNKVNEKPGGRC